MFKAFKFKGKEFLSVNYRDRVHVVDVDGRNYGTWHSVDSFKSYAEKDLTVLDGIGKCELSVRSTGL